jgi:PAS domain S-box-containing protein
MKILILDDNPTDAEILRLLLSRAKLNCEFRHVINKDSYRKALNEFLPDIILSDHALPQFDSVEALAMARLQHPGIPFIIVTGTVSEEFAANIIKSGADDFILKDRMSRLPAAIETVFRLRQAEEEKLETQEKLRLSEEKYRTIFLKSPLPKWIYDCETLSFLDVNDAAILHYGYSRKEFLRMTIRDVRPKEDLQLFLAYLKTLKLGLDSREGIWRHVKKNGEIITVETSTYTIASNNRSTRMVISHDITARIEAEEKIAQSETNLRTIFENTSEAFFLLNKKAVVVAFNRKAADYALLNKAKEARIGQSIYDCIESSRKEFFREVIKKALNGESIQYDMAFDLENSETVWIDFSVTPVIEARQVTGICVTGRNITEKKIIEQEREFDRNNLKALINNTNDPMWSVDRSFKLITSNEAFDKMVKGMLGVIIAKESDVLANGFSTGQLDRFRKYYERAFDGESFTEIVHVDLPNESWSEISFYPIRSGDTIIGAACFSRDITERKKAEENLKSLEWKILDQKIQEQKKIARAIITTQEKERNRLGQELHDNINQLLASTKLYLGIARKDEKLKELIDYPIELLDNTMNEIRILSSKLVAPPKNINLKELIQSLLDELDKNKIAETAFVYNVGSLVISNDLKLNIYRIIQEQLNNVMKHAQAKKVSISVQSQTSIICIVISDDGVGFDVNKKSKGIGILNMMNRVESFNGTVAMESTAGDGSKVEIKIPC